MKPGLYCHPSNEAQIKAQFPDESVIVDPRCPPHRIYRISPSASEQDEELFAAIAALHSDEVFIAPTEQPISYYRMDPRGIQRRIK